MRRGAPARAPPPPGITARRDPRRAELFRRLDAACDARRGEPPSPPHFAPSLPPPPPEALEEDDRPIWPPRSRYWERYKSLRNMELNPENSMISPTENSVSPPSGKRQKTLSDKDSEDQCGDALHQVVVYKNDKSDRGQGEQSESHLSLEPSKPSKCASVKKIGAFAAQCSKCQKWRLISTKEKYEEIRERIREDPFVCEKAREWKPDVTCNDPSDVSQDGSKLFWAIDKPDIAQAPQGWERLIKIRGERSTRFADVYYKSPTGVQLRSTNEVEKYLAEHPEYVAQGVELSHFSFKSPAPLQKDYVRKRTQASQSGVRQTGSMQPISWAAPPQNNKQLVVYSEEQTEVVQSEPLDPTKPESPPPVPAV